MPSIAVEVCLQPGCAYYSYATGAGTGCLLLITATDVTFQFDIK